MALRGKDLLTIGDLSVGEVATIMDVARKIKKKQRDGEEHKYLAGKTLGMIFHKASTRTRVSFEVGFWQLGGHPIYLNEAATQMGRGEETRDTARVLSRYVDGIMIRTYGHHIVEELAKYAAVPVINGLTDKFHPCQALADIFTFMEYKGTIKGRKLVYVGDGNNMAHSLMLACARTGVDFVAASPKGYEPEAEVLDKARLLAEETGAKIKVMADPLKAAENADALYTDVWASMGMEAEQSIRQEALGDYQINRHLLKAARPDAIVMHCLPAHLGEEITDEVMEGRQSAIFDQAENRLHVQKAIMALLMSDVAL
jgi:ornithine carbamoyltransferase